MPDSLTACHSKLTCNIGPCLPFEPVSVIQQVEEHRWYWRPAQPRVVLLAESHVYTGEEDIQRKLRPAPALPDDLPRSFVRLVYCLGYGENALLDTSIATNRNSGTPHFWKIFYSCLHKVKQNEDFAPILVSRTPQFEERIKNKIEVLKTLKDQGVWLVDASIAALYIPQAKKPSPEDIEHALHTSWDGYTRSVIEEAAPQAILCIGLGVARFLQERLDRLKVPWAPVPQPNARLSTNDHLRIFSIYHNVCNNPEPALALPSEWKKISDKEG